SLTAVVADEPEPPAHAGPLAPVISGLLRKDPAARLGLAETEPMLRRILAADAVRTAAQPPADGTRPGVSLARQETSPGGGARRPRTTLAALAGVLVIAVITVAAAVITLRSPGHQASR